MELQQARGRISDFWEVIPGSSFSIGLVCSRGVTNRLLIVQDNQRTLFNQSMACRHEVSQLDELVQNHGWTHFMPEELCSSCRDMVSSCMIACGPWTYRLLRYFVAWKHNHRSIVLSVCYLAPLCGCLACKSILRTPLFPTSTNQQTPHHNAASTSAFLHIYIFATKDFFCFHI
jgi:hypothetical protein